MIRTILKIANPRNLLMIMALAGLTATAAAQGFQLITASQNVTISAPAAAFDVSITSSDPAVSCTEIASTNPNQATISCTDETLAVGGTETLTATVTFFNGRTTVTGTAASSDTSIATIAPASIVFDATNGLTQSYTVTGVAAGSTTITISFQ